MPQWVNRIVGHGRMAVQDLTDNPSNWRTHPEHQLAALAGTIDEVGFVRSVTVNQRTGNLVDGHARVVLARRRNEPEVEVEFVDLSPEEEETVLLTLDPLAGMVVADRPKLAELLAEAPMRDPAVLEMLGQLRTRWLGAGPRESTWQDAPGAPQSDGDGEHDPEGGEDDDGAESPPGAPLVVRPIQLYVTAGEYEVLYAVLAREGERLDTETVSDTVRALIAEAYEEAA